MRNVICYFLARGGEAPISRDDQDGLGGSLPTVKAVLDALVSAGVVYKDRRRYARPTTYSLVKREASGPRSTQPPHRIPRPMGDGEGRAD